MLDKTNPLPSIAVPVVDRRRRWLPEWYKFFKPLLEQTRSNTIRVEEVSENGAALVQTEAQTRADADEVLATQISTVSANLTTATNTLNAAIVTETNARVTQDTALAGQITSLTGTVNANTAALTTEQTARVSADTALSQSISTVSSTVGQNTTAIQSLTSSVNGVLARWGIAINTNGRIVGRVRMDGGASGSVFDVLADKFIIVHPAANNTTIQAFITGLVNGISTIGINGNLIVDGTVAARSIVADTLSAISGDMGTLRVGKIEDTPTNPKFLIDATNRRILLLGD